jgi:methyltransferase (TIGR00027 family)
MCPTEPPPAPTPIQNVSDTARWVALYRAMESERKDAHFHDPFARRLAGERGEAILASLKHGRRMAWPMVVRTCVLDELILRLVREQGADAVLNLASGLDARPWRLDLPPTLRWFDADLPGILEYKRTMLADTPPRCVVESRAADLTDVSARRALFDELNAAGRRVVVVTEGLLIYLEASAVADLARDLHARPSFRWWLMDLASPGLLRMLERSWAPQLRAGNAPLRFGPAEGTAYFAPFGWREAEYRSMWDEAHRLKREMPLSWLWRLMTRFAPPERREEVRRFSGIVRMDRA